MNLILMIYLTHLLIDFIFQSDKTVEIKSGPQSWNKLKCLFLHAVVTNLSVGFLLFIIDYSFNIISENNSSNSVKLSTYLLVLIIVSAFHFLIDLVKAPIDYLLGKAFFQKQHCVVTYTLDQILHVFSIYLAVLIKEGASAWITGCTNISKSIQAGNFLTIIEMLLILFILETKFSEYFIEKFLTGTGVIKDTGNTNEPNYHLGGYIGNLERTMIALFFLANSITSISIVVAIKAVTRFKALENEPSFAEYYLIGSILSLLLGCLFPLIGRFLFL